MMYLREYPKEKPQTSDSSWLEAEIVGEASNEMAWKQSGINTGPSCDPIRPNQYASHDCHESTISLTCTYETQVQYSWRTVVGEH